MQAYEDQPRSVRLGSGFWMACMNAELTWSESTAPVPIEGWSAKLLAPPMAGRVAVPTMTSFAGGR